MYSCKGGTIKMVFYRFIVKKIIIVEIDIKNETFTYILSLQKKIFP